MVGYNGISYHAETFHRAVCFVNDQSQIYYIDFIKAYFEPAFFFVE
jgi:hypothetical protein